MDLALDATGDCFLQFPKVRFSVDNRTLLGVPVLSNGTAMPYLTIVTIHPTSAFTKMYKKYYYVSASDFLQAGNFD